MTTTQPHIDAVRQSLLATLADLRDKENPMDVARARAVAEVATVLVNTAKVEIDYLRATGQDRSTFLEIPPDDAVAHLGNTPASPLPSGITNITRHRLRG